MTISRKLRVGLVAMAILMAALAATATSENAQAWKVGTQGCTLGYWKNHTSAWVTYSPNDTIGSVYNMKTKLTPLASDSLLTGLAYPGGPDVIAAERLLLKQSIAGILNVTAGLNYTDVPVSKLIVLTREAIVGGDRDRMITLAGKFELRNRWAARSRSPDRSAHVLGTWRACPPSRRRSTLVTGCRLGQVAVSNPSPASPPPSTSVGTCMPVASIVTSIASAHTTARRRSVGHSAHTVAARRTVRRAWPLGNEPGSVNRSNTRSRLTTWIWWIHSLPAISTPNPATSARPSAIASRRRPRRTSAEAARPINGLKISGSAGIVTSVHPVPVSGCHERAA